MLQMFSPPPCNSKPLILLGNGVIGGTLALHDTRSRMAGRGSARGPFVFVLLNTVKLMLTGGLLSRTRIKLINEFSYDEIDREIAVLDRLRNKKQERSQEAFGDEIW